MTISTSTSWGTPATMGTQTVSFTAASQFAIAAATFQFLSDSSISRWCRAAQSSTGFRRIQLASCRMGIRWVSRTASRKSIGLARFNTAVLTFPHIQLNNSIAI